ncbi:MAG: PTS sugar transporter subunit IIC [Brevinema sp.]
MTFLEKFSELGYKFGNQRHMDALKNGLMLALPATLGGSLFLILRFLPIPGWNGILESILGSNYGTILSYPVAATFDMIGIITLIGVSYYLAESYKVSPISGVITALCGYFTLTPSFHLQNIEELDRSLQINGVWGLQYTGATSLFVIILCAIASVEIYRKIVQKGFFIKLPDMVPPNVANNFITVIPLFTVLFTMWVIRILIALTPFETIHNLITTLIQTPLMQLGNTFFGYATLIFFKDLFWTIGIHGPNMMGPILQPLELAFGDANRLAFETGESLPYIFTYPFRGNFLQLGGSGNTFMFTIMCAFFAKSERLKSIGKLSLGPAFFQINEPIMFGIPIVLNPIMMIPFIFSSFISILIAYTGMSTGLVSKFPGITIPWTTPPIINAYLTSNGSLSVVLTQIVILVVTALMYYPFFLIIDKQALQEETSTSIKTDQQSAKR